MIGRAPMMQTFPPAVAQAPPAPRPAAPPPVIRAQSEDEPAPIARRPAPLVMPTPEQLGVAQSPVNRFERLGATCLHLDKLPDGVCRVTCLIPAATPGAARHFEARAASADEATRLVLDEVESWVARR